MANFPTLSKKDHRRGESHTVLMHLIVSATDAGIAIPCLGPHSGYWTSRLPTERREAARACKGCPLIRECNQYATQWEESGVWGGRSLDQLRGEQQPLFHSEEVATHA